MYEYVSAYKCKYTLTHGVRINVNTHTHIRTSVFVFV